MGVKGTYTLHTVENPQVTHSILYPQFWHLQIKLTLYSITVVFIKKKMCIPVYKQQPVLFRGQLY